MPDNLVSTPPLQSLVIDKSGRFTRAWSRWFQQLYMRTSYTGSTADGEPFVNAIDNIDQRVAVVEQEPPPPPQSQQTLTKVLSFGWFIGVPVNGEYNIHTTYNVASFTRQSAGIYNISTIQETFNGSLWSADSCIEMLSFSIAPTANTDLFEVRLYPFGFTSFQLQITEVTQGVGNSLTKTFFDPTGLGDRIRVVVYENLRDEQLAPA